MGKTILVILDACQFEAGTIHLGFLEHMIDCGCGAKYKVRGELPSLSRPMYETLLTGLPVYKHGVTSNDCVRRSKAESLFTICREHHLTSGAAAYYWISELYNKAPFCKPEDRIQINLPGFIDYGIFYWDDLYPDTHLFADGEYIRKTYNPDFMLYHSMGIDEWGHLKGAGSFEYENAVANAGNILAQLVPQWLNEGAAVVITADHGMNAFGMHGGTDSAQRDTPLYIFGGDIEKGRFDGEYISQLNTAPLLCRLLDVPAGKEMIRPEQIRGLLHD